VFFYLHKKFHKLLQNCNHRNLPKVSSIPWGDNETLGVHWVKSPNPFPSPNTIMYSSFTNFSIPRERNFCVVNFDALLRVQIFLFTMNFFLENHLFVNNIHAKFQGQKIYIKKIYKIYQHMQLWEKFHCCQLWYTL